MKCSPEKPFEIYSNHRHDRESYVTFHDVIPYHPKARVMYKDFRYYKSKSVDTQNLPYDATSILHYTSFQGSVDGTPTFTSNVSTNLKNSHDLLSNNVVCLNSYRIADGQMLI